MLEGLRIGFCITGSYCTFNMVIPMIESLIERKASVFPIVSFAVDKTDTRFNNAETFKSLLETATGNTVIRTIPQAEPLGPKKLLDIVVVAPCTGNTLAKLASAITDTPVTMAVKSHLRNNLPVVIGISTNDALGANAKNIGSLFNMKNIFFIPFYQDDPINKEKSLLFKKDLLIPSIESALKNKQLQPVISA